MSLAAIGYSMALRNAKLDAIEATIGPSAILVIYAGDMPETADLTRTGTALATMNLPADWMAPADAGTKSMEGTWQDASADTAGLASYFSIFDSSGATCHIQGRVSMPWYPNYPVAVGQQMHNGDQVYRCITAGTTGATAPTVLGNSVTDGSVVWASVGVAGLTVENVSIAPGQQVTITTFSITDTNG